MVLRQLRVSLYHRLRRTLVVVVLTQLLHFRLIWPDLIIPSVSRETLRLSPSFSAESFYSIHATLALKIKVIFYVLPPYTAHRRTSQGSWGRRAAAPSAPESGKVIIFRAQGKCFGQKPAAKNEKLVFVERRKEFIPSSEIKCLKSLLGGVSQAK